MSAPFELNLATTDPDVMHQWIADNYAPISIRAAGRSDSYLARHLDLPMGHVQLSLFEDTMATQLDFGPSQDTVLLVQTLNGRSGAMAGNASAVAEHGDWVLINPDVTHQIGWYQNLRTRLVRFDRRALERIAAEKYGDLAQSLRFPLTRMPGDQDNGWQSALAHLTRHLISNEAAIDSPLARGQAFRQVASALLNCFPITPRTGRIRERNARPAAVRKAIEYMDEHADRDIDPVQIAEAADADPLGLERAFRAHLGCSITTYLLRNRLDRAHQELRTADPEAGMGVAEVAARWGFAHVGRFAAEYHQRYGRHPYSTLCA